jgi:hypothetical protein
MLRHTLTRSWRQAAAAQGGAVARAALQPRAVAVTQPFGAGGPFIPNHHPTPRAAA